MGSFPIEHVRKKRLIIMNKKETKPNPEKQEFPLHPLSRPGGLHSTTCSTDPSERREHLLRAVWMSCSPFFTSVKNPFKNLRPLKTKKRGRNVSFKLHLRSVGREKRQDAVASPAIIPRAWQGTGDAAWLCFLSFVLSLPSTLLWPFSSDTAQQWSSTCGPLGPQLQRHLGIC